MIFTALIVGDEIPFPCQGQCPLPWLRPLFLSAPAFWGAFGDPASHAQPTRKADPEGTARMRRVVEWTTHYNVVSKLRQSLRERGDIVIYGPREAIEIECGRVLEGGRLRGDGLSAGRRLKGMPHKGPVARLWSGLPACS